MEAALPKLFLALSCIQRRIVQRRVLPLLLPLPTSQTSLPRASLLMRPHTFTHVSSWAFLPRAGPPLYLFLGMFYDFPIFMVMTPVTVLKGKRSVSSGRALTWSHATVLGLRSQVPVAACRCWWFCLLFHF